MLCFKERGVHGPGFAVESYGFFADEIKTLFGASIVVAIIESASNVVALSSLIHDGGCNGKAGRPLRAFLSTRTTPGRSNPDDSILWSSLSFGSLCRIGLEPPLHVAVRFQAFGGSRERCGLATFHGISDRIGNECIYRMPNENGVQREWAIMDEIM